MINRLIRWLFPAKPLPELTTAPELTAARLLREAARARYIDAVLRHDCRDINAYRVQLINATSRVLALEMGPTA